MWYIAAAAAIHTVAREVLVKRQATHQTNAALFHKIRVFFFSLDHFFYLFPSRWLIPVRLYELQFQDQREREMYLYT